MISVFWNRLNGILLEKVRDDLSVFISIYAILREGDIDYAYVFHMYLLARPFTKEMHVIHVLVYPTNHIKRRNANASDRI